MTKFFAALLLMLVAFSANVTMAQEMPPIPVDPEVRIGKLDCGLTYYIRNNNWALDLSILFRTVGVIFNGKGAY